MIQGIVMEISKVFLKQVPRCFKVVLRVPKGNDKGVSSRVVSGSLLRDFPCNTGV